MEFIVEAIKDFLLMIFRLEELVVLFISIVPIVEARGAVPIAVSFGFDPFKAWFFSVISSIILAPVLLFTFIPLLNWLSKTKLFKKVGTVLYEKFEEKSEGLKTDESAGRRAEIKKLLGLFAFVAIPLPLTGVWSACAVAALLKVKVRFASVAITLGNFAAGGIMTLLCFLFKPYIDIITLIIGILALIVAITIIVKIITSKSGKQKESAKV